MSGFVPFGSGFSPLNFKPLRGCVSKDDADTIIIAVGVIVAFLILVGMSFALMHCDMHNADADADQVQELVATPGEVELAHTVVREGCDGTNCFVYIANPANAGAGPYDDELDSGPFLRLLTANGNDLSFGISNGRVFDATRMLLCRPESRCGIAPIPANDGMFELVVYDAPRREHTSYIQPGLQFALTAEEAESANQQGF